MENENKKPKKTLFISKQLKNLNAVEKKYYKKIKKLLNNESDREKIGYVEGSLSFDNKKRSLILSREIIDKIEYDHGPICAENIIINAFEWEFALLYKYKDIDKINLIKQIPNSHNYLLIAANRDNGFFIVTYFETKSINDKNLKRLLGRGNVISRGPSVCL
jgi:hypothetical protein